jgi:coiled-coil domain-containing protein 63/114
MDGSVDSRVADYAQLQREYRNMELNRKAYADESNQVLRRQQAAVEKLRHDNEALKTELAMETRHVSSSKATSAQSQLASLHEQGDAYTGKIEGENRKVKTMEDQIQLLKQKVLYQRKHMGGINAARENQHMIQKQIRILENRLDKALVKFNEALAHNKKLRESIDNLRRERVVFDNIYRKLERELHEKKKQMANIIELSNLAYEQRDASQMEVAAIEQQNRKEQEDFEDEMVKLGAKIEEQKQAAASARFDEERDQYGGGGMGEDSFGGGGSPSRRAGQAAGGAMGAMDSASAEKVQDFEEAFHKIKAATGISNIQELVRTFIKNEDQNFSLFNYVNEQTNEIEKMEEQIQELKEEEAKYAQEGGDDASQHKQLLRDLEMRLQSTESMAERYEQKCSEATKTINSLKMGIQSIFNRIDCGTSDMAQMLADSTVTEANMMQYLGMIEQRTNEILQSFAGLKVAQAQSAAAREASGVDTLEDPSAAGEADESATPQAVLAIMGMGPPTPMGQDLISVDPPNLEDYSSDDDSDEDDDDARPLTREELKAKTLKGIHRKANKDPSRGKKGARRR